MSYKTVASATTIKISCSQRRSYSHSHRTLSLKTLTSSHFWKPQFLKSHFLKPPAKALIMDSLPSGYRPNVGVCLINSDYQVLPFFQTSLLCFWSDGSSSSFLFFYDLEQLLLNWVPISLLDLYSWVNFVLFSSIFAFFFFN